MQKWLTLALALSFLTNCTSSLRHPDSVSESHPEASRDPQHITGFDHDHGPEENQKFENSFQTIMNEPTDEAKTQSMAKFLRRQMGFFYMAQDMVHKFDSELDRLYEMKQKNPQAQLNTEVLERYQFQLNIGREMTERNLHELQYMYARLLEEAHKPNSPHRFASAQTLSGLDRFFQEKWSKQEDKPALYSLALEFQDINQRFKSVRPQATAVPDFNQFTKIPQKEKEILFKLDLKKWDQQRKLHVEPYMEKEWRENITTRPFTPIKLIEKRTPQAANIYPDAGVNGTINGSKFAPGVWTLTYDDGPHRNHTESIMETLHGSGYPATFFWLAKNMKAYPDIVNKASSRYGFRRASHSYNHANLPTLSDASLKREIDDASEAFASIAGRKPTFFRCPYGACGPQGGRIRQRIANNKMIHVMWNVDSLDWQDKNPRSVFERVRKQMELNGKGIVLFHDIHGQTVEATKLLVQYLKTKSQWRVMNLDEVIKMETGRDYESP